MKHISLLLLLQTKDLTNGSTYKQVEAIILSRNQQSAVYSTQLQLPDAIVPCRVYGIGIPYTARRSVKAVEALAHSCGVVAYTSIAAIHMA